MKTTLRKRIGSLALCVAMVLSMSAGFPRALAANPAGAGSGASNGKPKLYINFLGDNGGAGGPTDPTGAVAPADTSWRYSVGGNGTPGQTIFWVGVGIDNIDEFVLANQSGNQGLSSLELGFYYNSDFVRPYTGVVAGDDAAYLSILSANNIGTGVNQWSGDYQVAAAVSAADPAQPATGMTVNDAATQEYAPPAGWAMTYLSIHKVNAAGANRFSDAEAGGSGDEGTRYVAMIPFVLTGIDTSTDPALCFRLALNAFVFSAGGGEDGHRVYGAWEKNTAGDPEHNLKLMLDFTGDLNIFTGEKESAGYRAALALNNGGRVDNKATLGIWQDPAPHPVTVSQNGDAITGLLGGTELELKLSCAKGFTVEVTVTDKGGAGIHTYTYTAAASAQVETRFTMPDNDVTVAVKFTSSGTGGTSYRAGLEIEHTSPETDPASNRATVSYIDDGGLGWSIYENGDVLELPDGKLVTVTVELNSEYDVKVEVRRTGDGTSITAGTVSNQEKEKKYTFTMPAADVTVKVTFTKANHHAVKLVVTNDPVGDASPDNLAKLSYTVPEETDAAGGLLPHETDNIYVGASNLTDTLELRDRRIVTVTIPGYNPAYTVKSVRIFPQNPGDFTAFDAAMASVNGAYTFVMPKFDAVVTVTFEKVPDYKVKLVVAGGPAGGSAALEATDARGPHTAGGDGGTIAVFVGTTVHIKAVASEGYTAGVEIRRPGGAPILPGGGMGAWSFVLDAPYADPDAETTVTVTFTPNAATRYSAELVGEYASGSAVDARNLVKWRNTNDNPIQAAEGEALVGEINVAPGYYIGSVIAETAAGAVPITVNGNGYHNGDGTGTTPVTAQFVMPAADVTVRVTYVEGEPPAESGFQAKLVLDGDPGGVSANFYLKNAAGTAAAPGNYVAAEVGETVTGLFETAEGYYITGVTVTAAVSGVTVNWQWTDAKSIALTMPASHVTVSVKVETLPTPPQFDLILEKQESAAPNDGNTATLGALSVGSNLIDSTTAAAGDSLPFTAQAADGYTVLAVLLTDAGGTYPAALTSGGLGTESAGANIVMPAGALTVTVVFGDSTVSPPGQYALTLAVSDPDNPGGVTNTAQVYINGAPMLPLASKGSMAVFHAYPGDDVVVETVAAADYAVTGVAVTPLSHGIAPVPQGGGRYAFVMPGGDATATVTFHKAAAPAYTVDLVLRGTGTGTGTLGAYGTAVYSMTAAAGTPVTAELFAAAGSYISAVTVTPAALGVSAGYTGAFARQSAFFVMPAADCILNVYLEEGWPGDVDYAATLKVIDPANDTGNHAQLTNTVSGSATNSLSGTAQETIRGKETERMEVAVDAAAGFVAEVTVTDGGGQAVAYAWSAPGTLAFAMPASPVTVEVRYRHAADYTVMLHVIDGDSSDQVEVKNLRDKNAITWPGSLLTLAARPGDAVAVDAAAGTGRYVLSALAMQGGTLIPIQNFGGGDSFVMPAGDVDLYVTFTDTPPVSGGYTAALVVTADSTDAGSAAITDLTDTGNHAEVFAQGMGQITVAAGGKVRVEAFPAAAAGYHVADIRLTSAGGTVHPVPLTWTGDGKVEFTMPAWDVAVEVVLEKTAAPVYRAQIVVNGMISGVVAGSALLSGGAQTGALLTDLPPGTPLEAIITVTPGYIISSVLAVPGLPGGALTPTADAGQSQAIPFAMPANNVVIYVDFAVDPTTVYSANLSVTHAAGSQTDAGNKASIGTPRRPTLTTANMNASTSAPAAAGERVTVLLSPDTGFIVDTYSVTDSSGAAVLCMATADGFTFLMPEGDVDIEVVFTKQAPAPRTLTLHVTDVTGRTSTELKVTAADLSGSVEWVQGEGDQTLATASGRKVSVAAQLPKGFSVAMAYALYGGAAYPFSMPSGWNETAPSSSKGDLYMPAGNVDVYVVLGYSAAPPVQTRIAVLTVNGPSGKDVGEAGSAVMSWNGTGPTRTITVQSGAAPQYLLALAGEAFTVTVTVNDGYAIAAVTGSLTTVTPTGKPNEYTFTMPTGVNVGVTVTLKKASSVGKVLKLHVGHTGADLDAANGAAVSYTDPVSGSTYTKSVAAGATGAAADVLSAVPPSLPVTLTVKPQAGYYVDAAYVLTGTTLVSLSRPLEGTDSATPPADARATFLMPAAATDVFVFYKKGVTPTTPWYNVVFMATDVGAEGNHNTGASAAELQVGAAKATVRSDASPVGYANVAVGTLVELRAQPGAGYALNSLTATPAVTFDPAFDPAVRDYTFHMPDKNLAVVMHFGPDAAVADLTLTVEDPDNGGVANRAEIALDGAAAPELSVVSTDSTGGTYTKKDVPVGTKAALTVTAAAGFTPWAEFVTAPGGTKTSVPVPLARTVSGGIATYTGSFTTAAADGELVVHMKKSPVVVVEVRHDGVTANSGNTVTLSYTGMPPLTANSVNAGDPVPGNISLPVPGGTSPVTIAVAPAAGYQPVSVTVTGRSGGPIPLTGDTLTDATGASAKEAWFTMPGDPDEVVTVTVTFGAEITERDLELELLQSGGPAAHGSAGVTWAAETRTLNDTNLTDSIQNVKIGETVTVTVHPDMGYRAKLKLESTDSTGAAVVTYPTVTEDAAAFAMPGRDAKLTVEFLKGYTATLVLRDLSTGQDNTANMTAANGLPPLMVTVNNGAPTAQIKEIPLGATLSVTPGVASGSLLRGILVTDLDSGSTTFLTNGGSYAHTVTGDVTITVLVKDAATADPDYLAAVELRGDFDVLGNDTEIKNTTNTSAQSGPIWTAAKESDRVDLTVSLAPGYYASITARTAEGNATAIALLNAAGDARATLTESGTYHFAMPAANVAVTVTYFEKDYIAQLFVWQESGNPGNAAAISYTDRYSQAQSVDYDRGILVGLRKNDIVTAQLTPAPGSTAVGVAVTREGSGSVLAAGSGAGPYTFSMPAADVAVSAVFRKDSEQMFLAAMNVIAKEGETEIDIRETLNTASIKNNAGAVTPAAPAGGPYTLLLNDGYGGVGTWVTAYPGDVIEIAFSAERIADGGTRDFYALVTAVTESGTPLTVLQTGVTGQGTARFLMPNENVQATVTFDTIRVSPGAANALTVVSSGHAGISDNKVTVSDGTDTITLTPNGLPADLTGTVDGVSANTAMRLTAAADSGYRVVSAVLTAGVLTLPLALDALGEAAFLMPDTAATLTVTYAAQYTATLHLSPDSLTGVTMAAGGSPDTVSADGGKITDIPDDAQVTVTAPATVGGLVRRAVLAATAGAGTFYLAEDHSGVFLHTIAGEDVDITVVYDDDSAAPDRYVAAVSQRDQSGSAPAPGNAAAISTSTAGLASGSVWTEAAEGDTVTLTVTLAEGYSAVVTAKTAGGAVLPLAYWGVTADEVKVAVNGRTVEFAMPADNVQVSVVFVKGYTATLRVPGGNEPSVYEVSAADGAGLVGGPISVDGQKIEGLAGSETISTTVTPGDPATSQVSAVIITKESGSTLAVKTGASYNYTMPTEDITVTPIVTKIDGHLYIAAVNSAGAGGPNDAVTGIENTTEAGHPAGTVWAAGKETHQMEVRFTTEPGSYAVVTAVRTDTGAPVPVLQLGITGSGRACFVMPAANVQVTVTFSSTKPSGAVTVDLVSTKHGGKPANKTTVTYDGTPYELIPADGITTDVTGQITGAQIGTALDVKVERDPTYSIRSVELSLTGVTGGPVISVTLDAANKAAVLIPTVGVTLTVTYSDTPPTPQPWDPEGAADPTVTPNLETGHLTAKNTGTENTVAVSVPVLRSVDGDGADQFHDVETDDDPAFHVKFRFYYEKDGILAELMAGTDIALGATDYSGKTTVNGIDYTGAKFNLTGLTEDIRALIADGGVIYITATRTGVTPDGADYPESDKTQLVLPGPDHGPRPYDHRNGAETDPVLEKGYIYAANYGDRAELEIPALIDGKDILHDADGENLVFRLYILTDEVDENGGPIYAELLVGTDVILIPVGDPVETATGGSDYTGVRFTLALAEGNTSAAAQALAAMLDNDGSIGTDGKPRLFVTATDMTDPSRPGPESMRTEVWLPPYKTLAGTLVSYAPTHEAILTLQALMLGEDGLQTSGYAQEPVLTVRLREKTGSGLWRQQFAFKSSELVPRNVDSATYLLTIFKTSHITYERVNIELIATDGPDYEIKDEIRLIVGDIDGDGSSKDTDRALLVEHIARNIPWSKTTDTSLPAWSNSVYNPESLAYACDLNGDGSINAIDLPIQTAEENYNKTAKDYGAPSGLVLLSLSKGTAGRFLAEVSAQSEVEAAEQAEPSERGDPVSETAPSAHSGAADSANTSAPLPSAPADVFLPEKKTEEEEGENTGNSSIDGNE